jgi:DNA-binding beta-propeller fold protein YncE
MGFTRKGTVVAIAALLAGAALVWSPGSPGSADVSAKTTRTIGSDRIVSMTSLPEAESADSCEAPASASLELPAAFTQSAGSGTGAPSQAGTLPSGAARAAVAERRPLRVITDPDFSFAGVAVDPIRNEVILADENVSALVVYDRLTNTPPSAARSAPKRVIEGDQTFLEYANAVYVDPDNGDIFGVNNDTMNWIPVFGRDAQGNVPPKRKWDSPHTTYGIAADEQAGELFVTIQDDHAVTVFKKNFQEEDSTVRNLQGARTQLADPHGIALDPKRGEIFVVNWGTNNERPPLSEGGGGGVRLGKRLGLRKDFPVGRTRATPGSGKIQLHSITVYPKGAAGDTPPLRVIQGPKTHMNWPGAIAVHPDRGELFVANDTGQEVLVFRADANGDVAPIRVIKGPRTMIRNPIGVAVDLKNNELWVASYGNHSATVFRIDASGDAAPLRIIRSAPPEVPAPMLTNAHTVAFDSKRDELLVAS